MNWQKNLKKFPQHCRCAHLFRPFFEILLLDTYFFFHYLVAQLYSFIWHFWNSNDSLWNSKHSKNDDMSIPFCMLLFPCYQCHAIQVSHDVNMQKTHDVKLWRCKLMVSLLINLLLAIFYFLNTSIGKDQQIWRWPQYFQQQLVCCCSFSGRF